ncbi:unnamed protein product [Peronospora belbahrii]|uniref:CRC domain-containing protein n=1 Tax=Peronospora belbahrii TaxID=622444 RepID=A0AAU9KKZ6_9STRA|nr:unnamed protein product [Peronospora belbahrii]
MKNYCECHQAGVACTSRCACHQCRNTETFVSAKKMLVFAGVDTDDSSLQATLNRSLQRKIEKRPPRDSTKRKDMKEKSQTLMDGSIHKATALELLSRSAPVAPSKLRRRKCSIIDDIPSTTLQKRPSSHSNHFHTTGECVVTPAFAKRKYTRRNVQKNHVVERMKATSSIEELPNVERTVTNAYEARNTGGIGDPALAILSRSLLHTAMTVELANDGRERAPASSAVDQLPAEEQAERIETKPQCAFDVSNNREALSPTAAGLFCEEEYSEASAEDDTYLDVTPSALNTNDTGCRSTSFDHDSNSQSRQNGQNASLSAMQERAVLQELSVWLRNMTANVSTE